MMYRASKIERLACSLGAFDVILPVKNGFGFPLDDLQALNSFSRFHVILDIHESVTNTRYT